MDPVERIRQERVVAVLRKVADVHDTDVPLVVTGGVDAGNAVGFLRAGAVAVGADSSRAREVYDAIRVEA